MPYAGRPFCRKNYAVSHSWQYAVLAGALLLLLPLRRGVVLTLLSAGTVGVAITLTVSTALS
jgi:chromate transporter